MRLSQSSRTAVAAAMLGLLVVLTLGVQTLVVRPNQQRLTQLDQAVAAGYEAMLDQDIGVRGYLLAGTASPFLEPYADGRTLWDRSIEQARALAPDADMRAAVETAAAAGERWRTEWADPALSQAVLPDNLTERRPFLLTGKALFDEFRDRMATVSAHISDHRARAEGMQVIVGVLGATLTSAVAIFVVVLLPAVDRRVRRLQRATEQARRQDVLTGLGNRRAFEDDLDAALARSSVLGTQVALLMVDLDHFKAINDTFGHPEGDIALRQVAEVIIRTGREIDRGYRIGGEEFALVLEGVHPVAARTLAESLRALVAALPRDPRLTCSIGVATFPADGCDRPALVKAADTALYAAKAGGRDRVKPARATAGDR